MAIILEAAPLLRDQALVPSARNAGQRHLRLVAASRPATPATRANPRLGAAICLGFCGIFWSVVVLAVALG